MQSRVANLGTTREPFAKAKCWADFALPPQYLGSEQFGVEELLNSELLKYNAALEGVMLAYSRVQLGSSSRAFFELPEIVLRVGFEALLFCPGPGTQLRGKVTRVGASNVGLVAFEQMQVSIPRERLPKGMRFDVGASKWVSPDAGGAGISQIAQDDELTFHVVSLHHDARESWWIEGSLLPAPQNVSRDSRASGRPSSRKLGGVDAQDALSGDKGKKDEGKRPRRARAAVDADDDDDEEDDEETEKAEKSEKKKKAKKKKEKKAS